MSVEREPGRASPSLCVSAAGGAAIFSSRAERCSGESVG
jgi:hypothetical protein